MFIYIVEGEGWFENSDDNLIFSKRAVLFNKGDELLARASKKGFVSFCFSGAQLKEPIAWGGPIVMNTQQELKQAFQDIDNGTFVK